MFGSILVYNFYLKFPEWFFIRSFIRKSVDGLISPVVCRAQSQNPSLSWIKSIVSDSPVSCGQYFADTRQGKT